ncbi:MAG: hypothetical protein KA535_04870 [Azonexus sp.]|nr:hypothetical protein [Azonexus sp.]
MNELYLSIMLEWPVAVDGEKGAKIKSRIPLRAPCQGEEKGGFWAASVCRVVVFATKLVFLTC